MIRMKAEAVVITKPDINTNINGANINMNGKVLLQDAADKGYKGAGMLSGEVVLCLASGDRETKAAETAMNILTKHIPAIKTSGDSFPAEADSFFNHAFRELSMQNGAFESFSATLLYNYADNVYIANSGDNAVYTFDGVYLDQIDFAPQEKGKKEEELPTADINTGILTEIKPGTQIIVLSKEIYEYTTDEQILDILRNAVSTKQACQKLIDQAAENGAESYTAVLIESLTPTEIPVAGGAADSEAVEDGEDGTGAEDQDLTKPSKAPLAVLILLLILVALIAGIYFADQKYGFIDKLAAGKTTAVETETEPSANMITIAPSTSPSATVSESKTDRVISTTRTPSTTRRPANNENNNNNYNNNEEEDEPAYNPAPTDPPAPTDEPTDPPTDPPAPTDEPTNEPTDEPSNEPSDEPSDEPSADTPPAVDPPEEGELV